MQVVPLPDMIFASNDVGQTHIGEFQETTLSKGGGGQAEQGIRDRTLENYLPADATLANSDAGQTHIGEFKRLL